MITYEISTGVFKLYPFIVTGMMPLCLGGIFKVDSLLWYYAAVHNF